MDGEGMRKRAFLVMNVHGWHDLLFGDGEPVSPIEGSIGFVPVFGNKKSAERWTKGRCQILEVMFEKGARECN